MSRTEDTGFLCVDCGFDTCPTKGDEYYMVNETAWFAAGMDPDSGMLCIGCLEQRLGRTLTRTDFPAIPINQGIFPQSARLRERTR